MVKRREKATEVWKAKPSWLGKKNATFEQTFPRIKSMRIEIEEEGEGTTTRHGDGTKKHSFSVPSPPGPYIDCSNPLCYNGGLHVGRLLKFMVERGDTELESVESCQGFEGSPKGRKKHGECLNMFKVKIQLEYKD